MSEKRRAVSLIRPNGGMHIGQYFGSVNRFAKFQDDHECFFGIADLHQITLPHYWKERRKSPEKARAGGEQRRTLWEKTVQAAVELRACGVDPERSFLFVQSLVPEHVELAWILGTYCRYQDLCESENFKEARRKQEEIKEERPDEDLLVSASFLSYPVLQAADILAYQADVVPTGSEQKYHVGIAARIANQLNAHFKGLFPQPEFDSKGSVQVMGLVEPRRRMARRYGSGNFIGIFEEEVAIRRKIQAAVVATSPGAPHHNPGIENLLQILEASAPDQASRFREQYEQERLDTRKLEEAVAESLSTLTARLRKRRIDPGETAEILRESSARLRVRAAETLRKVKAKLGLDTQRPPMDGGWWQFAIEPEARRERVAGFRAPERPVRYDGYLGLDALLGCQTPTSQVPDERVFIAVHQMIELSFKLLHFDLGVVATTLEHLAGLAEKTKQEEDREAEGRLRRLVECADTEMHYGKEKDRNEEGGAPLSLEDELWLPALTASSRIEFACREQLPMLMRYLSDPSNFSGAEFYHFRSNLDPGSGFQSAQYRLVQRALGKENMLSVRLFPSGVYRKAYRVEGEGSLPVIDETFLGKTAVIASPLPTSPLHIVGRLDEIAHQALAGVALLSTEPGQLRPVTEISEEKIKEVVHEYKKNLDSFRASTRNRSQAPAEQEVDEQTLDAFEKSFRAAVEKENGRRRSQALTNARQGAYALELLSSDVNLKKVLRRLVAADDALHGKGKQGFLQVHRTLAKKRIDEVQLRARFLGENEQPAGTGGSGVPYLAFISEQLVGLFPALVALRELDTVEEERVWQDL